MKPRIAVVAFALMATLSSAQTFPPVPRDTAIYDGANLIAPSDRQAITQLSNAFSRDTGAPIVVATLPSLSSVGATSIESYSTALFNNWHIGRQQADGGILLVVAQADHKVRIELGKDWKHDYDAGARQINQQTILPAFKRGDFSGGIRRGCEALARLADANAPAPASQTAYADPDDQSPNTLGIAAGALGGLGLLGCLCPIAILVGIVLIVRSVLRNQGRRIYTSSYRDPNQTYYDPTDPNDDGSFATGLMAGQLLNQPDYDPGPSYDSGSSDSGGFDSGGFDSGSSGGGGDTGSW